MIGKRGLRSRATMQQQFTPSPAGDSSWDRDGRRRGHIGEGTEAVPGDLIHEVTATFA
jgi:hypothetical protein